MYSGIRDNHSRGQVGEFLKEQIKEGANLSIVSAYFTIYAYEKLKEELNSIHHLRFLFGQPTFIKPSQLNPDQKKPREYKIEDNGCITLENTLHQKAIAKQCAEWLRQKAEIRSMVKPNFLHGKLYHILHANGVEKALMGSSNFTVNGLGLGQSPNIELNMIVDSERDRTDLKNWFDEIWDNQDGLVEDVKEQVLAYIEHLYAENSPEFIYFKTLFHLFENYLKDEKAGGLLDERTGFFDSEIWNMLYDFQKDGVKGAINKIEKHGGCIVADSVGLGKTFEALAVIKYYDDGKIEEEKYFVNNEWHRENDKPAEIEYYENGNVKLEKYCINGHYHRDNDNPSYIKYDKNGNIKSEKYYIHGIRKRENPNNPSVIKYKNNGNDEIHIFTDENGTELRREEIIGVWTK